MAADDIPGTNIPVPDFPVQAMDTMVLKDPFAKCQKLTLATSWIMCFPDSSSFELERRVRFC